MRLKRRSPANKDIEKQVLIGLITSDKVISAVRNLLEPNLFIFPASKTIAWWIKDYDALYSRAPKQDIQDIYIGERSGLDPEEAVDIQEFLSTLSKDYVDNPPNEDMLLLRAEIYLKKLKIMEGAKEAITILESINGNVGQDVLNLMSEAEVALSRYKKHAVKKIISVDPMDPNTVYEALSEDEHPLLKLSEPMGSFIGPLHRGYVVGILGAQKKGKTWHLQQMANEALSARLKVLFISLEMPAKKLVKRFWQQVGVFGKVTGKYQFPYFDCAYNQDGTCHKAERISHVKKGEAGYEKCFFCRERSLITGLEEVERPGITVSAAIQKTKGFSLMYGRNNFRILSYPAFSANLQNIMNDVDILEWNDNFIPDVIALDYPGILAAEKDSAEKEYVTIGETWKTIKRLAEERQVLFLCPIQTDRAGTDIANLKMKNTAGYIQIIAHLDKCITLNQKDDDYEKRIMRIGKIADRWDDMRSGWEIKALTQLQCGQPLIDGLISKIVTSEKGKKGS